MSERCPSCGCALDQKPTDTWPVECSGCSRKYCSFCMRTNKHNRDTCGKTAEERKERSDLIADMLCSAFDIAVIFGPGDGLRELPEHTLKLLEWKHEEYLASRLQPKPGSPTAYLAAVVHGDAGSKREEASWRILRSGNRAVINKFQELVLRELLEIRMREIGADIFQRAGENEDA